MPRSESFDACRGIELQTPPDAHHSDFLPFRQKAVDERLSCLRVDDLDDIGAGDERLIIEPGDMVLVLEPKSQPPSDELRTPCELVLTPHIAVLVLPFALCDTAAKK